MTSPVGGDKMSVLIMDIAVSWWLRMGEMVPQIAKSIPKMLRKASGYKKDTLSCINNISLGDDAKNWNFHPRC